jgi:serine/threonine protein kinase
MISAILVARRGKSLPMSSPPDDTTRLTDPFKSLPTEKEELPPDWGKYKILSLLGEGGMAKVYKAFDPTLKRYVALKFIRSEDESHKKRLLLEARSQAQIEHDHVCKIYEVGEVEGKPFIAMQLIQGETLLDLIMDISFEQKIFLMQQISDAVQSAHKIGIIHRDIKPSNIMVERKEDGSWRPYIMDFGIARDISDPGITATNVVIGTPAYMAPEQVMGQKGEVDRRTDVYALGATLYAVLAGKPPFDGSGMDLFVKLASEEPVPLGKLIPSVPEDLDTIVSKCLEKEASRRYDSARSLADDLGRYLAGEPIFAHRATWQYRITKKIKKNKTVAFVLLLASLLILASAGFGLFTYVRTSKQVAIARQLSQSVEAMDWIMRVAHMGPLHDIRKEQGEVLQRMREIETMMKSSGSSAFGPGNFALGRGYLALQNYDQAYEHLQRAWNAGYHEKEVAGALGLALGAIYKRKLSEADRITDAEMRKAKLQLIEKEWRNPAVQYLRSGSANQSGEYGEALISYYEKKWDQALQLTRIASQKYTRLYEAGVLEGDVYARLGEKEYGEGNFDPASKYFQSAGRSYTKAGEIARSDPALYQSQCSLWRAIMEVQLANGKDAKSAYDQSKEFGKKAISVNSESATAFELLAQAAWRWGENQFENGEDPSPAFQESIDLSHKAQKISPDHAYPYYTMGTSLGYLADYALRIGKDPTELLKQSIQELKTAIQKDPGLETAYTNLGVSYFGQGAQALERGEPAGVFFQDAIEAYKKALEISPRSLAPRANIANAFSNIATDATNQGRDPMPYIQQSIENYKKALEINPNHWLIRSNLANVYLQQIRYELDHGKDPSATYKKIIDECEKADKLKPGNPYAAINLADAHLSYAEYMFDKNENPLPLIQMAQKTLTPSLDIDVPEVFLALSDGKKIEAQYLLGQKKSPLPALDDAKKYLEKAFKINSSEQLVPLGLARLEMIQADWLISKESSADEAFAAAEKFLEQTLKLNPKSGSAYEMYAEISLKKSEIQKGLTEINKSIELNSNSADAHVTKAKLLLMDAQTKSDASIAREAIKNFEHAFSVNPQLRVSEKENFQKAKLLAGV